MGYIHYWTLSKNISEKDFALAIKDCEKICKESKIPIQYEYNDNDKPIFSENEIRFNGVEEDGHETFSIHLGNKGFDFCKTACKPYDINVTCCLIVFKHYLKNNIKVNSDGNLEDWQSAIALCQKVLGYGKHFEIDE